jgi:hypothetical protein
MKHADLIKRLIQEALSTPPKKESCNCGCHSCENVGNPGPVLNESLSTKIVMTENMKHHVENKLPLTENMFRYGSEAFLDMWAEARYLFSRNAIHVNDLDKEILLETNLGEYGIFEGQKVPLDLPILEESEIGSKFDINPSPKNSVIPFNDLLYTIKKDHGDKSELFKDAAGAILDKDAEELKNILRDYGVYYDYENLLNLNEAEKKKTPALNKPKRGGSKKFYVYVRDPKSKRIKKVSFGMAGGGLRAKLNNPKARQAFSKRHNCPQKTDKTKASYWSCRIGRYWKSLGGDKNFTGYW